LRIIVSISSEFDRLAEIVSIDAAELLSAVMRYWVWHPLSKLNNISHTGFN
jgi:hypothetical protein